MTSQHGYVWFLPHWLSDNYSWMNFEGTNHHSACSRQEMMEAIKGHFSLSSAVYGAPDSVTVSNITVKHWKKLYMDRLKATVITNFFTFILFFVHSFCGFEIAPILPFHSFMNSYMSLFLTKK